MKNTTTNAATNTISNSKIKDIDKIDILVMELKDLEVNSFEYNDKLMKLLKLIKPYIYEFVKNQSSSSHVKTNYEDIEDLINIKICNIIYNFNSEKGHFVNYLKLFANGITRDYVASCSTIKMKRGVCEEVKKNYKNKSYDKAKEILDICNAKYIDNQAEEILDIPYQNENIPLLNNGFDFTNETLEDAFNSLSEVEKKVLKEFYVNNNNTSEIAKDEDFSRQYINSVRHKAINKLKKAIEKED